MLTQRPVEIFKEHVNTGLAGLTIRGLLNAYIGRRCECIFTGMMVTGVIKDIEENKYSVNVKVHFDKPQQWGDDLYTEDWAWGRKTDEFGTLHHLRLLADEPDFQTMTVVFGEPISQIDRSVFEDVSTWGVSSLRS